jgi:lysophospholipase L1-like esterase
MVPGRLRIVGIGDSTTAGTPGFLSPLEAPPDGAGNRESQYAYWMRRARPDWQVANCGVNGETSGEILERFPRDVLTARPDYVIVLAGVNDLYRGASTESVESNLLAMYSGAQGAGIRVVTATVLPYNSMTDRQADAIARVNRWVEGVSKASGFAFCDTHGLTADPRDPNRLAGSPDGLHPDVPGYRRMGEGLAKVIENAAARPDP